MAFVKKWLAALLSFALVITGCPTGGIASALADDAWQDMPTFNGLSDPELLSYIEDAVYDRLIDDLADGDYYVENVQTTYVSKEYLEELAYNSQANIYFGYTLQELEDQFAGERFVFTLGDGGQTVVKSFESYDDTYDQALQKIAVGGGVILLCVTVAAVTAGAAPAGASSAVSVVFAMGAKSAATLAASSGVIGAATAGIVTAIDGASRDDILKAAAAGGADGFMWGAIGGALVGGTGEARALRGATAKGLTMNEAAILQRETKYPLALLRQFHSMDEAKIYKEAGLQAATVNGKKALVRQIDWKRVDERGRTNAQRVKEGLNPLDEAGKPYELHHIGQNNDASYAVLTESEHMQGGNNKVLHWKDGASEVDHGSGWDKAKSGFWKSLYEEQTGATL